MATLVTANGGGNWTTAGTWRNVCTGSGALLTTLTAAQSVTSTSYLASVAFTVTNTEVIEGVALHLQRSGTTGTLTVGLSDDNGSTYTREVTVNLSDLPTAHSWVFFKFGSTLTADGGSDYRVAIKLSSGASGVSIFRGSGTTNDWSHILREDSAPGSLVASDVFYIWDDLTGAGIKTTNTVTMNNTDTTDWGAVTVGLGTLSFGVNASTNYYLKVSGDLTIWGGGTFTIGTVASPMPNTSTAVLEFDPTSDGEFGLITKDGSTLTIQGASMARVSTLLNADAAVNATSLTTLDTTGWADNDQIAIASTTRTAAEQELGTMNGAASGTTLTVDGFGGVGGGLAYAHSGNATGGPANADIRAEIINLTRNVKIRSATSTVMSYVYIAPTATVDIDYAQFYYIGENATTKRGIEIATTTGSCSIQYSSVHDTEDFGVYISTASGSVTYSYNVHWNLNTAAASSTNAMFIAATSGVHMITYCVYLKCNPGSGQPAVSLKDVGSTFTNITVSGSIGTSRYAIGIGEANAAIGTISDLCAHSNAFIGLYFDNSHTGTLSNLRAWRNVDIGLYFANNVHRSTLDGVITFGNSPCNIFFYVSTTAGVQFRSVISNSETSYTTGVGLEVFDGGGMLRISNSSFSASIAHGNNDIRVGSSSKNATVYVYNTILAATAEVGVQSTASPLDRVLSLRHDASPTTHKSWYRFGTITSEQTVRYTASGYSWRLTPNSAANKLVFPGPSTFDTFRAAVVASAEVTVTVWVRKDSSYNGNAPRLVLVGGVIEGIASDVTDSLSVAADTWEQLSVSGTPNEAGVLEWYVDCDGTAGNIYVDDMAVSQSGLPSSGNLDYPSWGLPIPAIYTLGAAVAGGLLTHPGMAGGLRG